MSSLTSGSGAGSVHGARCCAEIVRSPRMWLSTTARSLSNMPASRIELERQLDTDLRASPQLQALILNCEIHELQLNVPLALRYSFVYQKVQSSLGSTVIAV